MKMKIKIHEQKNMSFTGSKVLKSIMDTSTPGVDLFIRESIQNSMDAVLKSSLFCRINIEYGIYKNSDLYEKLEVIDSNLKINLKDESYNFLSVADSNTCGLLGEPILNYDDQPNNLYNLVYDFMNSKNDNNAGGSWGIGKSVYYRYGIGLCFYYSRTLENGKYINKLAGALIQNEKEKNCLLGAKSSGIAFFGDLDNHNNSIPIYNENEIKEFLNIFNLKIYDHDKTGTIVIIPYIDNKKILSHSINQNISYWKEDVVQSIKMSIQRWYFPKLNNSKYNGNYLICAINNDKLELNDFFKKLQELYNGEISDGFIEKITHKNIQNRNAVLGYFKYKKFTKEELGIECPPNNLPSPYIILDIEEDNYEGNQGILFYTRKPGMIITYDSEKFGKYKFLDDGYLIGVFVLNDNLEISNEKLGGYIRFSEKANHKEWVDINEKSFPYFSNVSPFKKICSSIKRILNEKYSISNVIKLEGAHSIFQKKLGQKLLPPDDFGNKPTPKKNPNSKTPKIPTVSKKKKICSYFNGFNNGMLSYTFEVYLKSKEYFECQLLIKTTNKIYSFNEWESLGFMIPCKFIRFEMDEYCVDNLNYPLSIVKEVDEKFLKRMGKKDSSGNLIFSLTGIRTNSEQICGFKISSESFKPIKFRVSLLIKPFDLTYSIDFDSQVKSGGLQK